MRISPHHSACCGPLRPARPPRRTAPCFDRLSTNGSLPSALSSPKGARRRELAEGRRRRAPLGSGARRGLGAVDRDPDARRSSRAPRVLSTRDLAAERRRPGGGRCRGRGRRRRWPLPGVLALAEGLEDRLARRRRDADAGVGDAELDARRARARARTVTLPRSVNLMPLSSRFLSTILSFSASVSSVGRSAAASPLDAQRRASRGSVAVSRVELVEQRDDGRPSRMSSGDALRLVAADLSVVLTRCSSSRALRWTRAIIVALLAVERAAGAVEQHARRSR